MEFNNKNSTKNKTFDGVIKNMEEFEKVSISLLLLSNLIKSNKNYISNKYDTSCNK